MRESSDDELLRLLDEARQELFNLRFQGATGSVSDVHRAREVRKDIARIMTVLRERELAGSLGEAQ